MQSLPDITCPTVYWIPLCRQIPVWYRYNLTRRENLRELWSWGLRHVSEGGESTKEPLLMTICMPGLIGLKQQLFIWSSWLLNTRYMARRIFTLGLEMNMAVLDGSYACVIFCNLIHVDCDSIRRCLWSWWYCSVSDPMGYYLKLTWMWVHFCFYVMTVIVLHPLLWNTNRYVYTVRKIRPLQPVNQKCVRNASSQLKNFLSSRRISYLDFDQPNNI